MSFAKILVPVDFEAHSAQAVRLALDLARPTAAEIVLVYVCEPAGYPVDPGAVAYDAAQLERVYSPARARLEAVRADVVPRARGRVSARLVPGTPARAILELAQRDGFDLIVMGTHGRTGVDRIVMGSVAEAVVRRAPCAVLTVKRPARPARSAPALLPSGL